MPFNIIKQGILAPCPLQKSAIFLHADLLITPSPAVEKAPTASSASGSSRNDKPLREITLITSDRPVPDAVVSPTGFWPERSRWQCRYRFFRLFFRSVHARNQDIPRLTITRRFIDNVVFQIFFLRPTVQVVVVRGTAQLQSVMAGRCRFHEWQHYLRSSLQRLVLPWFAPGMPSVLEP